MINDTGVSDIIALPKDSDLNNRRENRTGIIALPNKTERGRFRLKHPT